MQETKLLPSEIELVSRFEGNEQRFYYQKKSEYPDPSQPEAKVDKYEEDKRKLYNLSGVCCSGVVSVQTPPLMEFLEKHFVRKEP